MHKHIFSFVLAAVYLFLTLAPANAHAALRFIGEPKIRHYMEIRAAYLQSGIWEPTVPRGDTVSDTWLWWPTYGAGGRADIHLEALVRAVEGNPHGFSEGEFIPYLKIGFIIAKKNSDWYRKGFLMAMATRSGLHYGDDIALDGAGTYRVIYQFNSPTANGLVRHTDPETGVPPFWEPFDVKWEFTYIGVGKKGDY